MNSVRNLFRILCILAVTMSFINCQTDTVTEIQQEETLLTVFPFKSSVLTKQDVEANAKLSNQMRSLATLQSNSLSESVYNSLYNFTVTTDVVNFVENTENDSHSYTFPIERDNNNGTELENLVFTYNEATEDYTASLVTYHFNAPQKQEFFLMKHVSTTYDVSHQSLSLQLSDILGENSMTTPCTSTYTTYHITPNTGETFLYSINGNVQNTCEHEYDDDPCETYTVIEVNCPDGGSSSANDSGTPNSGTANTTSTGGGNNSGSGTTTPDTDEDKPNIVTSPISKDDLQRITEELNQTLGEGNWEFGSSPNSDDTLDFNSQEELQNYIESLPTSGIASESSSEELQSGNMMTRFSFPTAEFLNTANIKVDVVTKLENSETGQNFEVIGINSRINGFALMMSWEQNEYYAVFDSASNSEMKRILMTGVIKRGIVYEGIDITISTSCIINMEINKYDGADGDSDIIYIHN